MILAMVWFTPNNLSCLRDKGRRSSSSRIFRAMLGKPYVKSEIGSPEFKLQSHQEKKKKKPNKNKRARGPTQVVKCLPSKHQNLSSIPVPKKRKKANMVLELKTRRCRKQTHKRQKILTRPFLLINRVQACAHCS
jgi:hypothetical protein